jgi:putative transcriptional regulator
MSTITPGTFLISALSLEDPNFNKVVLFICEHNPKGAMGFVINKVFPRAFNELAEFNQSVAFTLYSGGPVEKESLFFIHQRPDLIEGGTKITGSIYLGGNFKQAVANINSGVLNNGDIRLFIGYCGWDDSELEAEIAEGSWIEVPLPPPNLFSRDNILLWEQLHSGIMQ